jgi:hypothetical protein
VGSPWGEWGQKSKIDGIYGELKGIKAGNFLVRFQILLLSLSSSPSALIL